MDINQEYAVEVINISKIKEGLYAGDEIAATNLDVIIQFKLTHMLNATGLEVVNKWETIGVNYLTLNWSDTPTQNLFDSRDEIANRIVSFIDDALERGEGLLVHSLTGQNRVCIVIVIYLMKKYKWCLQKCIEYIQTKKTDINIQPYFIEQLQRFQERLIHRGEQIKSTPWSDDNITDDEERLLRNTYINSLESSAGKVPKELISVKKRKHIEWADANPYKKEMLVHINEAQDLVYQRDPRPVTTHKRMKPGRSCMRKKNAIGNGDIVRSNSKGNVNVGYSGSNVVNIGKQGVSGFVPNSYSINNVRPLMQRQNSASQGVSGVNPEIGIANMIGNNSNNSSSNTGNAHHQQQVISVNTNDKGQPNINNFIPIQRSIQVNTNNNNQQQRFYNVNANDLISNYTKFYNNNNNNNNNNPSSNNAQPSNINVNMNMNNQQQQQQPSNLPRTNSYTNKDPSTFLNMKNNFNIASPNSLNPDNLRNYSIYKDANNNPSTNNNNNNNNNKEHIIFATKYEQIINNNIININNNITNTPDMENTGTQKGKAYIKLPSTSSSTSSASNINAGIGPIPNIQFPSNTNNINFRFNNTNTNNNLLPKQNNPSTTFTNNYINTPFDTTNNNNERKMKVIDYSNNNNGTVLNNYQPQSQLHKPKQQPNHTQNQCKHYPLYN